MITSTDLMALEREAKVWWSNIPDPLRARLYHQYFASSLIEKARTLEIIYCYLYYNEGAEVSLQLH